jgi:tetratricopeptide (TPR) repeat protein
MMASSARIEELEKKFNENPRRYFAPLANEYRKAGDVQQAIAICRTYVPQQPGHMSGHIVFGQALFEAGDHDEARGVFEAALGLDPENLIALRHLGDIAREHGESDEARAWYRRVLDADPRNDEVAALLTSVEAEQAAAADEPATWMEINPEQTLELPPDVLAAVPRDVGFAGGPVPRPPAGAAASMGELFDVGEVDIAPSPDVVGAATLEFRSPTPYPGAGHPAAPPGQAAYADEAASTVPAFVTETMAELYVQQGFYDQALSVYRQLLTQHPGDPKLAERMEQLRLESAATPPHAGAPTGAAFEAPPLAHAAPSRQSVREFFSEMALRRPKARTDTPAPQAEVAANEPVVATSSSEAAEVAPTAPAAEAAVPGEPAMSVESKLGEADAEPAAETVQPAPVEAQAPAASPSAEPPARVSAGWESPAAESGPEDVKPLARDLDIGFTDETYHETYSAEFGASALTIPDDDAADSRSGPGLFEPSGESADPLVVRPSGEADAYSLLGFGMSAASSEFDVTAFESSGLLASAHESHGEEAPLATRKDADSTPPVPGQSASDSGNEGAAGEAAEISAASGAEASLADEPPVAPVTPAREEPSHAAMQTGSVNVLFPQHPVSAPDEAAAATLSSAFGGPSFTAEPKPDAPTASSAARPALNELSLDSVFRESPAATPDPRRESTAFSFDQFFGDTPPAAPSGGASGADSLLGDSLDVGSADAEQFSNWLSGLKKK